jgi:hypothetical protein
MLDRKFDHGALLRVGQAHRLGGVHGQRQRIGAMALMEIDQIREQVEIDAVIAPEGHHGRMHETKFNRTHEYS